MKLRWPWRTSAPGPADLLLVAVATCVLVAMGIAAIRPGTASLADRARILDAQIRCPVCQGTSIADSPASLAVDMRAEVAQQLGAGASDDQVRVYFVERYGSWIWLSPSGSGPQLLLWGLPVVVAGAGLLIVLRRARRRRLVGPSPISTRRLGRAEQAVIGAIVVAAVALPLGLVAVPRPPGAEITGTTVAGANRPTVTDLDAVVRQHPDDPEALVALGDAQLSTGDSGAAISTYERALAVQPDNAAAALALGVVLLSAGQAAQAKGLFDRVLAAQPAQPDALLYRALARFQLSEPAAQIRADALAFLAVAGNDPRRTVAEQLLDFAPTPTP